jgi:S-layer protein
VSLIDSKTVSGAAAAYQILSSAGPGDATSIANKLAAASAFTAQIDTAAEIAGYVGSTAASYGRAYLSGVDATAVTLNNAINSQTLANTVAVATNTVVTGTPSAPTGQTFTLTTGADTFSGTDNNDSFVGTLAGAFGKGDSINGGNGTDTLTVTDPGTINSSGVTVSNVENASFTAGGNLTLDTSSWTGLQSLTAQSTALGAGSINVNGGVNVTVKASNSTTGNITVGGSTAPTGEINVTNTSTGAVSMGSITVTGGTKVTVNQQTTNALNTTATLGYIGVVGTAQTTSVTVNNAASAVQSVTTAGVTTNQVGIQDINYGSATLAGSITDVSISNYNGVTIRDTALKNLTLVNGSNSVSIQNSGLAGNTNTTLNLKVNGLTGGALIDQGIYTTLNLTSTGSDSQLANINFSSLLNLNVAGTNVQTLTSTAGMSALNAVTISGSAGLVANLSGATVTSVNASGTSGNVTVTLDASKASYTGGSGVDKVTLTTGVTPSKILTGGAGTGDVLTLDATDARNLSNANLISGFEQVVFANALSQNINAADFAGATTFSTQGGNNFTLNNLTSGNTIALTGAGISYTLNGNFTGSSDTLKLQLSDQSGAAVGFAVAGIAAAGVEIAQITTVDNQATPTGTFNNTLTWNANDLQNVTVSGNAGLTLQAGSTAMTSVDASGITLGGFTWSSGLSSSLTTVKGSASGTNTINFTLARQAVTYTGGSGNDAVTVDNGFGSTINLGEGNNSLSGSVGADPLKVTAGAGNDTISLAGNGLANINAGNGNNAITLSGHTGASTITTGSGNDTITIGAVNGAISIDSGSGNDILKLTAPGNTSSGYAQVSSFSTGDKIDFSSVNGGAANTAQATLGAAVTLVGGSTLSDYLNAAAGSTTAGTTTALTWFQYSGNTYVVLDASSSSSFVVGSDSVVQLNGVVDLTGATIASNVVTLL